jgi:hypothetical protein
VLVALDHYNAKFGAPSCKSTPVLLRATRNHKALRDRLRPPTIKSAICLVGAADPVQGCMGFHQ